MLKSTQTLLLSLLLRVGSSVLMDNIDHFCSVLVISRKLPVFLLGFCLLLLEPVASTPQLIFNKTNIAMFDISHRGTKCD